MRAKECDILSSYSRTIIVIKLHPSTTVWHGTGEELLLLVTACTCRSLKRLVVNTPEMTRVRSEVAIEKVSPAESQL